MPLLDALIKLLKPSLQRRIIAGVCLSLTPAFFWAAIGTLKPEVQAQMQAVQAGLTATRPHLYIAPLGKVINAITKR